MNIYYTAYVYLIICLLIYLAFVFFPVQLLITLYLLIFAIILLLIVQGDKHKDKFFRQK